MAAPAALNTPSRPSRAYPELFALLGGQTPDLRGLFLRGHGGSSAALGVRQTQSLSEHTHGVGEVINGTAITVGAMEHTGRGIGTGILAHSAPNIWGHQLVLVAKRFVLSI